MSIQVWKFVPGEAGLLDVTLERTPLTLDDTSLQLPGGAYTTFRTYHCTATLLLDDHLHRLEETARLADVPQALDTLGLRAALRRALALAPLGVDLRFRLTIDLEICPGDVYIAAEPLTTPPAEAYAAGVRIMLTDLQRRLPKAKLTRFIARAGALRQMLPNGIDEAVMVNPQGFVLEGLSSNFFGVRAEVLWTAEADVLSGITRSLVLEAARQMDLPLMLKPVHVDDLTGLDDAFITSSSRAVLPVVRIGEVSVGAGFPGPVTHRLSSEFDRLVNERIKPI